MKTYNSIIVTGSVAYDEIMDFPGQFVDHFHPEKLHQINISFVVDRLEKQLGGIATNISYNASLFVPGKVKILSGVGKDGDQFMQFYKKHGIDSSGMIVDTELYTSTGKVITDKKDNQIWGFYYGALAKTKDIQWNKYIASDDLIIISPTHVDAFMSVQNFAIDNHIDYIYDPGMALTWITEKDLAKGIEHCTYLIGNDYEIAQIQKRLGITIIDLLNKGIAIITTLGAEGAQYVQGKETITVGSYKKTNVVDPTGAGDAWRGAFASGLVNGDSIELCMKKANATASFAVEHYGTVNHTPTMKQIEERVNTL